MKKLFYFSVHPLCILTEVPPILLLWLAFRNNSIMTIPGKLYPLMIVSGLWIVFTLLYFFRIVVVSESEIFTAGPFSTRSLVTIKKGKTVLLTKCPKGIKKIEVIGHDGQSALAFLKNREPTDISQLRETIYASDGAIFRIASLFGVPTEATSRALALDTFSEETDTYAISAVKKNEIREIQITLKKEVVKEENKSEKYHFRFFDR